MGYPDTDPVQRLLTFLSFRTVSREGPNGSYDQVLARDDRTARLGGMAI